MSAPLESKLRELGYLTSPLDAFGAAPAQGGSLVRGIAGIGARNALLIGPILGCLATAESAWLLPGLLHRPRDLLVFGLYQIGLYTAVFFLFGLLWGCAVALLFWLKPRPVGRPELLWRGFELLGGLFVFFYLALGWAGRAGQESSLIENALAVALFAALSFWVGRYLGLTGYSVVLRLRPETPVPRFRRRSARFVLAAGLGCVLLFSVALSLVDGGPSGSAASAPGLAVPAERRATRVLLVAVDGLGLRLLEGLCSTGRFPGLAALLEGSARAPISLAGAPLVPPVIWTSLATGTLPRGHGVRDFDTRMLYGVRQPLGSRGPALGPLEALQNLLPALRVVDRLPLSSAERQSKAVWEVLAEAGLPALALNWWASWPAGNGPASVVSDRAYTRLALHRSPLAPEGETYPPGLLGRLAPLEGCCPLPASLGAPLRSIFGGKTELAVSTAWSSDRFIRESALRLLREERPSFVGVYLRELDVMLRSTAEPDAPPLGRDAARGLFVDGSLADLDGWLARVGQEFGPELTIVLVGIPSALEREAQPGLEGVALWRGPESSGRRLPPISVGDLAPTLLGYYGLPISEELAGRPVLELLQPSVWARYPIRAIASYGSRREALEGQARSSYDESQIEMMRSLGYIE